MFPYNNQGYFTYPQTFSYEQPETIYYQGRAFVRIQSVMPDSVWIEKGTDGRGYYVRKKPAVPSLRKKFAEAFHDLRQRSQQANNKSQSQSPTTAQNVPITQNSKSNQESKSQADMANQNKQVAKPGQTQSQGFLPHMAYYGYPHFQGFNPYQTYAGYNPAFAANPYLPYQRPFAGMPHPFHQPPAQPGSNSSTTQPATSTQAQAPTISAPQPDLTVATQTVNNMPMSQMIMNPDGLKFKCMICGRFRSARYHLKHRLAPGQLPGPTICRKCRKHITESEDETSDSDEDSLLYRSRSAVRNRSRSRSRSRMPRAASRARPSSRMAKRREDFDYYALHDMSDSSSESGNFPPRSRKSKSRKAREVRYADEPHTSERAKSRTRKVIYMQEPSLQSEASDDEVEIHYIKQASEHSVRSRPGTPASPGLLKHLPRAHSQPIYVEQRVYYDEPPASFVDKPVQIPEFRTNNPYRNIPVSQVERHLSSSGYGPQQHMPQHSMPAGVQSGQPPAPGESDARFGYKNGPSIPYAPTPPEIHRQRSKAPSRGTQRRVRSIEQASESRARSRSRSQGRTSSERSSSEQDAPPSDDYDWYDANGMKIRVREI